MRIPLARTSAFALSLLVAVTVARADFTGTLDLQPTGCEKSGRCTLGKEFGFIDARGVGWQARRGLVTDGASIPSWARPLVGEPFDRAFIKAAVIHDHYCVRHVRPWRQTPKVFYEALRASAVPKGKAGIMYFAILVGGPKWVKLVKGKPCPVGQGCINQVEVSMSIPDSGVGVNEDGLLIAERPSEYDSARFAETMAQNKAELEAAGDGLTAEQVEAQAARAMAGDFYFANGEEVGTSLSLELMAK